MPFPVAAQTGTVTFGAAGDFNKDANFQATVNAVGTANPNFFVALGDLSYSAGSEKSWCDTWKAKYQNIFLITGNHDSGESSGGNIDIYKQHCPFTLGGLTGNYGHQYYFDYPSTNPLIRTILIRPGVKGSGIISYASGGAGYTFVSNAIDDARSKGIKWIVVGMHKNFISAMEKSDEVGSALMTLMFTKKVDLILQGHEHGYERSKQLKCAKVNSYDATCVVDTDNSFVKEAGTVILVLGTGGTGLRGLDTGDAEYPYFASANNTAYGFGKFTLTSSQLSYSFVRSAGGSLSDSFTISGSGSTTQSPTQPAGDGLTFDIKLHGIGTGGDNVSPNSGGNTSPQHATRNVTVTLTNVNNQTLAPIQGTLTYNTGTGSFQGSIPLPSSVTNGYYRVRVKIDQYLGKTLNDLHNITSGRATVPQFALATGDINNDNLINTADYGILIGCFSDLQPAKNCDATKKLQSDITDDGKVNQFDYNLFLRELSVQSGQ